LKIHEHTTRNPDQPEKLLDYDFKVEFQDKATSWLPWKDISSLAIFQNYLFDHKDEFEPYFNRLKSSERNKLKTPPNVFKERRKKVPNQVNYLAIHGGKDWKVDTDDIKVGIVDDVYINSDRKTMKEMLTIIADKFSDEAKQQGAIEKFFKVMTEGPEALEFQKVLTDLKPGEFMQWPEVNNDVDPSLAKISNPIRSIINKTIAEQCVIKEDQLEHTGRSRRLPDNAEIPFNNSPHTIIEQFHPQIVSRMTFDERVSNSKTTRIPWKTRKTIEDRINDMKHLYKHHMDIKAAFYQMKLGENTRKWHRWISPITGKKYEMLGMSMGNVNSPAHLQNAMDHIFENYSPYIDDLMWSNDNIHESFKSFIFIMRKCVQYNIKLAYHKITLFQKSIDVLGKLVDGKNIRLDNTTKTKTMNMKLPRKPQALHSALGLVNWGRNNLIDLKSIPVTFISYLTKELTPMLKEGNTLKWTDPRKNAFNKFKELAANDFPLCFYDQSRKINVAVDASDKGCGGIAFHINADGSKDIFAIHSMTFTNEQTIGWSINDKEAYAIFTSCRAFQHYLFGQEFNLFTDHKNLLFLFNANSPRVIRWRIDLGRLIFKCYHISGPLNWETDFLSRIEQDTQSQKTLIMAPFPKSEP